MPRKSKRYEMDLNRITFEIAVTFPKGDVNAIFNEIGTFPQSCTNKGMETPIGSSVVKYLNTLTQLDLDYCNQLTTVNPFGKAEVKETHNLMMGFCSITFEVSLSELKDLSELQEVIDNCKKVMRKHISIIRYYEDKTATSHTG